MNRRSRLFYAALFLAATLGWVAPTRAVTPEDIPRNDIFPLPKSIQKNVDFWIKVYTQWDSDCLIAHDARHLDIVYEVLDLSEKLGVEHVSERTKRRYARRLRDKYRRILRALAAGKAKHPERLRGDLRRVYELWAGVPDKHKFRTASRNVRVQRGNSNFFEYGLRQSGRYIDRMKAVFRSYGLPEELTALPHVESSFNYRAYSHMGAAGIWQFTRRTGRLFLRINYEMDERFDPVRATEAAAQLLKKNYEELGTWPLAITAYNHGLQGMKRAVRRLGTRDFDVIVTRYRSRSFKFASRNFYAEFLAALFVRTHRDRFFPDIESLPPEDFIEFEVPDYVPAKAVAEAFGVDLQKLRELNPALRSPVWRGHRRIPRGYRLRLPVDLQGEPEALYAQIPEKLRYKGQLRPRTYRVRRGQTLGEIARRLRVPLSTLMAYNNIDNPNRIRAGQILNVPPSGRPTRRAAQATKLADAGKRRVTKKKGVKPERATPKPAETAAQVVQLAEAPAASQSDERPVLGGGSPDMYWVPLPDTTVASGLPEGVPELAEFVDVPRSNWVEVQPEETLGHYAEWLKVSAQELRRLNGLAYGEDIRVGQKIRVTFRNVSPEEFHRQRVEYLRSIEEDFFSTYRVASVQTHVVKRGQNIWYLCNRVYDIPYWLIRKFNPDKDLASLHANDTILIPVVEPIDASRPEPSES
ncbi:MAG TPA: LysM peptidoglycan-binding domain-containing protein [Bacteroidetes bacterium]|nr:LysM peptidoglycan-binding domain-containing protein [Bacteroidota bacterium]